VSVWDVCECSTCVCDVCDHYTSVFGVSESGVRVKRLVICRCVVSG
jgi:hypothetical protein